jgi:hypothetical protein
MSPELPQSLLIAAIALATLLALRAPLHWLLLIDLALVVYPGEWLVSRVHVDFTDIILVALVAGIFLRPEYRRALRHWRRPHTTISLSLFVLTTFGLLALLLVRIQGGFGRLAEQSDLANLFLAGLGIQLLIEALRWRLPYLWLWLALGVLLTAAYVMAPINAPYFEGPASVTYQVYRYCWRPLLYYPLGVLLLRDRRQLESAFLVIVLCGATCSLMAFSQGFSGAEATGPFPTKNGLGGALIMPFLFGIAALFHIESAWPWRLHLLSVLIIARGLLFAGSRGAFVAVLGGLVFLMGWMLLRQRSRSRALRFLAVGSLLAVFTAALLPDFLQRPNIQHLLTTSRGTQDDNMRWRMQERWPHFWHKIMDNPWLGVGTDIDSTLGDSAITPHNGYLGVAVVSGLPSMFLLVGLTLMAMANGMRIFRRSKTYWQQVTGLAITASLVGLLVHNVVDQTFKLAFAVKVLWILAGSAALLAQRPQAFAGSGIYGTSKARRRQRQSQPAALLEPAASESGS